MSYFKESHIDYLYTQVNNPVGETVSICHECYKHVPALKYEIDNKLYMVKHCEEHGTHRYVIENDYEFYKSLVCSYSSLHYNDMVMFEISDKCNIDCPHCYHMPNNKIKDPSIQSLLNQIKLIDQQIHPSLQKHKWTALFAGAEASLHKNLIPLMHEVKKYNPNIMINIMTNGIKFSNNEFVKELKTAGLGAALIGLNHPSYIGNKTIRNKQVKGIENCIKNSVAMGYISYTMSTLQEMDDILTEITTKNWPAIQYRIRYGSDIGRNIGQSRLYLSDIYNLFKQWCAQRDIPFKLLNGDNNLYHIMVQVGRHKIRLIQWCDEYDIDMENLISGPWSYFVPGKTTNFLNQIIRRNAWKNKGMLRIDPPPDRYAITATPTKTTLDLRKLI